MPSPVVLDEPSIEAAQLNVVPEPTPAAEPRKWKFRSTFLLAGAVFLAMNAMMSFFTPFPFDPYKFNYKGWTWWTFNALRNSDRISNIALVGSSTMVSAIAGCDANFQKRGLDLTEHHRASYLEHLLKKRYPKGEFETFSLSAPGQMPSDAYISLKAMVATSSRPDVVIYGLAPRDFIDSTLSAPGDTDAFRYLTRIVNIDDVAQRVFRSPLSKLDWCFQRLVFLYGNSLDFRMALTDGATAIVDASLPRPWSKKPFTWWDRRDILPGYLPAEIHPEAVMAGPIDFETAKSKYKDNTVEYIQRYKQPDDHVYKTQMYFMGKIADYCRKERIELVLVNMPVTLQNLRILTPTKYYDYLNKLQAFSMMQKISLYDLNDFTRYSQLDFHDSVHLNAFGGQKFFEDVSKSMASDTRVNELVLMSGEHLAKHRALAVSDAARRLANKATPSKQQVPF
ncbi:MAG: hypothetical protein K2W95_06715 [Candidatus Obscuribacterales bacterium]|nr:hypothetical protein [Candidatus Obscuribacterales bacterium]